MKWTEMSTAEHALIITVGFLVLSAIGSWLLRKIPFVKEHEDKVDGKITEIDGS